MTEYLILTELCAGKESLSGLILYITTVLNTIDLTADEIHKAILNLFMTFWTGVMFYLNHKYLFYLTWPHVHYNYGNFKNSAYTYCSTFLWILRKWTFCQPEINIPCTTNNKIDPNILSDAIWNTNVILACIAGSLRRVATKGRGAGEILQFLAGGVSLHPPPLRHFFALSQSLLCQSPIWHPDRHFTRIY